MRKDVALKDVDFNDMIARFSAGNSVRAESFAGEPLTGDSRDSA